MDFCLTTYIPNFIHRQMTLLKRFLVNNNQFSGSLPSEIGDATALSWIDIGSNAISSTIPAELGRLSDLRYFKASRNNFSGTIPSGLDGLTALEQFEIGTQLPCYLKCSSLYTLTSHTVEKNLGCAYTTNAACYPTQTSPHPQLSCSI